MAFLELRWNSSKLPALFVQYNAGPSCLTVVGQTKCEDTSNANWASNQPTETDGYKVHMKKSDDYKWYTAEDEFKITPVCYDPNGG